MGSHYWEKTNKQKTNRKTTQTAVGELESESGSGCQGTGSLSKAAASSTITLPHPSRAFQQDIQSWKESSSVSLLPSKSCLHASHWWNQFASRTLAARESKETFPFPFSRLCRKVEWKWAGYTITLGGEEFKTFSGASLVVQWLIIRLPMQGTGVRALVWEDPTCCRATKLVHHNYWTCALEPASHNYRAHVPQLLKPVRPRACALQQEKPPQWEARAPQQRVAPTRCN